MLLWMPEKSSVCPGPECVTMCRPRLAGTEPQTWTDKQETPEKGAKELRLAGRITTHLQSSCPWGAAKPPLFCICLAKTSKMLATSLLII